MNDETMRDLLASVDEGADAVPSDFRDRLWADLQPTLRRGATATGLEQLPVVDHDEEPAAETVRRGRWLAVAAGVLLIAVAVATWRGGDGSTDTEPAGTTTTVTTPSTTEASPAPTTVAVPDGPRAATPEETCQRFLEESDLFPVGTSPAPTVAVIAGYLGDVVTLQADLEQFPEAWTEVEDLFPLIRGALREADRAAGSGDDAAAAAAVDAARGSLNQVNTALAGAGFEGCGF